VHVVYYRQLLDDFIHLNTNTESFRNSSLEAMSKGLPKIVFSDGGVLVEHVISGTNGYIVSCPDELTMRLRQLASDRELRLRLGTAGRQYVTRKYSYDNLVASYDGLYDLLLSR